MTAKGDHSDFVAFSRRILRALARRMAVSDPEDLTELLALRDDLDAAIDDAVRGLRRNGFSWADIARGTGTTRQAAFARWASKCP